MLQPIRNSRVSQAQKAVGVSLPAPTGGWDAVSPLADMKPDKAIVLDNFVPRPGYVEVRRGFISQATGLGTGVVDSLMAYHGLTSGTSKLFGAANSRIYDCTSVATATAVQTSLSNNRWQYTNFTTAGGKFLVCCNGADTVRNFDGSSWTEPTITGVTSSNLINVNAHAGKLWFVEKDTTKAWYLPTGSIAGAATALQLGENFTRGGYLVAMGTMTRDGGSGGDDLACFISSQGQVAVYGGTDPSDAQLWNLQGVYDLAPPIGYRCFKKVGADLALINIDGLIPVSAALGLDQNAQKRVALSANINNAINSVARSYKSNFGWQLCPYPKGTFAVLNIPLSEGSLQHQYIMNTLTGAWARFTGQNANCWEVFNDNLYFGGNAGTVYKADTGGYDNGSAIDATGQGAYNYMNTRGVVKLFLMLQPLLTIASESRPAVGISTDFKDNASLGTPSAATVAGALYDSAVYDSAFYPAENQAVTDWTTVAGTGHCASVHFRASKNTSTDADIQINGFNAIYQRGGPM